MKNVGVLNNELKNNVNINITFLTYFCFNEPTKQSKNITKRHATRRFKYLIM